MFLCLSFFLVPFFCPVGRMIFGSRAVTARRRKPRDRQTDRQTDRRTDRDRQTQTDRDRQPEREREA